ncbi:MAG: ATP-dependent zinc metalloprotease FtsH [Desulfofustis sp.]|nr:ATP-dependent zinc metalloprotease FtsH [Desulfofustis sp.]
MATLVRNLLIYFIFCFLFFVGGMIYHLETRLPQKDFSDLLNDIDQKRVTELVVKDDVVQVTTEDGSQYMTVVQEPAYLVSNWHAGSIRVSYRKDYTELLFFGIGIVFAVSLLLVSWLSLRIKPATPASVFANEKLISPGVEGQQQVTFDDVAGIPEAKEELLEIVGFLKDPELYNEIGATTPKGVLLQGPPGTGKTLLARAIAGEAGVPFYSFSGSDFVEMFVGVGAQRVRDLFGEAKKNTPCLVFIDEIDAVGASRKSSSSEGSDERGQTLNALLVEMDGFSPTDNIVVLAATNRPDILDPALKRSGRFDRQITIVPPDIKGRRKILDVHCRKVRVSPDVELEDIAVMTSGFTGAELASLVNEAALLAARQGKQEIDQGDFDLAHDRILLGVERKGMVITERDKRILAFHEAGHAIVAKMLPDSDPVHKITIIPRGRALGQTQQLPINERQAYSKQYLKNRITTLMGGRAAEELVFGIKTTGGQSDIQQATDLATNMVCKWGMSDGLGPQVYVVDDGDFLGPTNRRLSMSPRAENQVDREIRNLLAECYSEAVAILSNERLFLSVLADILMQVETVDGEEFDIIYSCSVKKKYEFQMEDYPVDNCEAGAVEN